MSIDIEYLEPRQMALTRIRGISDLSELRRLLGEIRQRHREELDHPIGVDLRDDAGNLMHVGLGDERWSVAFTKMKGEDEVECQCWAVGDPHAEGWDAVYFGQYTPIRRSEWLEVKEAWQVVRHWLETGGLSVAVEWRWE